MLRIVLVNMPFASWHCPSFALSQLAALAHREFPGEVTCEVRYPNQDFASYFGIATYDDIATNVDHLLTGVGEWMFRAVAFPEAPDNTAAYFRRFYRGPRWAEFREHVQERRRGVEDLCRQLIDRYDLASADVVGFTSMFAQSVPSIALARLLKERNPDVVTLMGGANCEAPMGAVLAERAPAVDYFFSGPALRSFPDLVACLLADDHDAAHAIRGVLTRRNCRDARFSAAIGGERDIDDFFTPEYDSFVTSLTARRDLMDAVEDGGHAPPFLYFETSRGCWWGERSHCTFCGLNGQTMGYRAMSAENALRQFRWLFDTAPWCENLHCTDNIMPKSYPKQVFGKLDPPPDVSIFYEVKLPISDRDLRAMAAGRVNRIQPGIEALSTETLSLMGKGTTAFQNVQFLKNCARYGIKPLWNLLIGFPREREEVYEKYTRDLPLLTHLPPPTGVYVIRFDRYSPYLRRAEEFGLRLRAADFYRLVYPFDEQDLDRLAYYFVDDDIGPYAVNAAKWHGRLAALIEQWRSSAREDERPQLRLEHDAAGTSWIVDTRFGGDRVAVDETTSALLPHLSSPTRVDRLATATGLDTVVIESGLARLDEHRFLFREGDRVMSLVITDDEETAAEPDQDHMIIQLGRR